MDKLATLLEDYSETHTHPVNKILHLIGVPLTLFAALLFFSWIHISMPGLFDIHTSWIFSLCLIIYFSRLDTQFSLLFSAILLPFIFLANLLSSYWISFPLFCLLFAIGWILQLVGHFIEGQQPTFLTKPKILLILPLLTLAEFMCEKGFRPDLRRFD